MLVGSDDSIAPNVGAAAGEACGASGWNRLPMPNWLVIAWCCVVNRGSLMFVGSADDDEEAVGTGAGAVAVRDVTLVFLAGGAYQVAGTPGGIRRQSAHVVTALRCPARLSTK